MAVRKASTEHAFGGKQYLGFEHLTVVPFQRELLDLALLSAAEVSWINRYHAECLSKLAPMLCGDDLAWLTRACMPIGDGA